MLHAGFYAMTSFHLLARDRPSLYKPFEVAAFLGFFAWCVQRPQSSLSLAMSRSAGCAAIALLVGSRL